MSLDKLSKLIRYWIYESAVGKTIGSISNTIGTGLITTWFIVDISRTGSVDFSKSLQTPAIYFFCLFVLISVIYHRFMYKNDDINNMQIKMLKNLAGPLEKQIKKRIQSGELVTLEEVKESLDIQ